VTAKPRARLDGSFDQLFEEFGSSMAANHIVQGPSEIIDLRAQLLTGCLQCGERIAEFMLPQDIACALTVGEFEFKEHGDNLLKKIVQGNISLHDARAQIDGLVQAAGDTATVLKNLKQADPEMFLQVLAILWRHGKEKRHGENNSIWPS
jgi:hypothetical protein